jgi:cell division protein FtsL
MASSPVAISRRQNWWQRTVSQLSHELGAWLYIAVVLGVVSALAFVYLAEASYVARQIDQMVELEQELDELHEQNSALLLSISKYEEVSRIETQAKAMGFGEPAHVEYLEVAVDDASPAAQGSAVQGAPSGAVSGGQQSAPLQDDSPLAAAGLRLPSSIAQQFQGWIGMATAAQEGY